MNENPKGSRIANPATGLRALMECGEFSPLSAGDSSPSEFGSFRSAGRLLRWREPKRPRFTARLDDLDGDKSPAESGDKSPHSKTRRANAGRRRTRMSFSLAPGFSRVSARLTSGNRFNGFKAVALSLGCAVLTLGSSGACADSKSAADAKAELAKLEQELRRLRAGIHAGQSNAVAASVKACPDGHKALKNVRISYGTPSFAPEHQKAREEAIARFEYWPGGCVVGLDSPTNRVTCTTCGLGLDSQFGFWSAYRPAPSQFRRPFSAPILSFPIPATNTALSGPTYYQTIHKGQKQHESLSYTTREPKEQVVKSVDAWFGKQGLTPRKRVQSNPGSGPTYDLVNWEAERLSVQLNYFGNEGTTAVYISNQLASYP